MTDSITLPFWPNSTDCVQWSGENQIAVLGGEVVSIIKPRYREPLPNGQWWNISTSVKINVFSTAELPRPSMLSDRNFSLGEETSIHQAVSAAWSPPGLAKHGGCALAVLTSNHVLSIWAPEGKGQSAEWKRAVVVSEAVRQFYKELNQRSGVQGSDERERREYRQMRQRIRSFTWTSPLHTDQELPNRRLFSGGQALLVATEGGHVLTLRVQSPYENSLPSFPRWTIAVTASFDVEDAMKSIPGQVLPQPESTTAQFGTRLDKRLVVDAMVLGDWYQHEGCTENIAPLVLIARGRVFVTPVFYDPASREITSSRPSALRWCLQDRSDCAGPLHYVPDGGLGSVIVSGQDIIFYGRLSFSPEENTINAHFTSCNLDGRWDNVSGITVTGNSSHAGSFKAHVVSQLFSPSASTSILALPLSDPGSAISCTQPSWQIAINNSKASYGALYDIGRHVQARCWGMAASPLDTYVATCTSMHSTDAIAYIIKAEQTSTLNLTYEGAPTGQTFTPVLSLASYSPLLCTNLSFYLKRFLDRAAASDPPMSPDRNEVIAAILEAIPESPAISQVHPGENMDIGALLQHIRVAIYAYDKIRQCHAARIVQTAFGDYALGAQAMGITMEQIIRSVLRVPVNAVRMDEFSLSIKRVYEIALSKLDSSYQQGTEEPSARDWKEQCQICQQAILFESFKWARCMQGHQFGRCALSLLAVQEPGTTKRCGVCGVYYLDIAATRSTKASVSPDAEAESSLMNDLQGSNGPGEDVAGTSLATLLFAACEVCIYCGGQFVD
jgi:hypothetical protein